jgi:hypothetical protein
MCDEARRPRTHRVDARGRGAGCRERDQSVVVADGLGQSAFVLSISAGEAWQRAAMFLLAIVPVAITIAVYVRFMIRDPDRLQSEEFRLRQRALKMLYKRGANAEILEVAKESPRVEKLPGARDEGDRP